MACGWLSTAFASLRCPLSLRNTLFAGLHQRAAHPARQRRRRHAAAAAARYSSQLMLGNEQVQTSLPPHIKLSCTRSFNLEDIA